MGKRVSQRGFTLVELLVVIAIIGVLIALLLPAIQAAREGARRTHCQNSLKQVALAFQNHESAQKFFPSSGWGWGWVGDPDRGFNRSQPGGWVYNLLPYIEQADLRDLGRGQAASVKSTKAADVSKTPIYYMNCPSRRPSKAYPNFYGPNYVGTFYNANNSDDTKLQARTDYAANSGSYCGTLTIGPNKLQEEPTFSWRTYTANLNGISYLRSEVKIKQVTDGLSKTYMVGEKNLDPDYYMTGEDAADNLSMYEGYDWDVNRWAGWDHLTDHSPPHEVYPIPDTAGLTAIRSFGSAHASVFNMAYCDGSVHAIIYDVDLTTHSRLANRMDGQSVEAIKY